MKSRLPKMPGPVGRRPDDPAAGADGGAPRSSAPDASARSPVRGAPPAAQQAPLAPPDAPLRLGPPSPPLARSKSLPQLQLRTWTASSPRLALGAKDLLRRARDENIDALMARYALNLVNGAQGFFQALNPGDAQHPQGFELPGRGRVRGPVEQRYQVMDAVGELVRAGLSADEIAALVDAATQKVRLDPILSPPLAAEAALGAFLGAARAEVQARQVTLGNLAAPVDTTAAGKEQVMLRLARVRWVESEVHAALGQPVGAAREERAFAADLAQLLAAPDHRAVLEGLDARFEAVMERALKETARGAGLEHIESVRFERFEADDAGISRARIDAQRLPDDHPSRAHLAELHARLGRGERSAIGGADYAKKRLPREVLDDVVTGATRCVVYDGTREAALEYVRDRYGSAPTGHRQACRVMGLQGLDGSGPRMLVTMQDGQRFMVLAGLGASRQLHNAGAVMLYETAAGARVDPARLELARDGRDLVHAMRGDLERVLGEEVAKTKGLEILGIRVAHPERLRTQLIIVQNPQHLERALPGRFAWGARPKDTVVPFAVAYMTLDGQLTRAVLPKVGGPGLYGDTAGDFVRAFFGAGIGPKNPNVLFNGTAGGFADTDAAFEAMGLAGLGAVKPGGLIVPMVSIEEYGDPKGPMSMVTLLGPGEEGWRKVQQGFEARGKVLALTDRHVAVAAPALETYELIDALVAGGNASVDVEGGAILRAVLQVQQAEPGVTFTPIYTHSDDPRQSRHDPFDSLAMMGPLFEGSTFDPDLYDLVLTLIGLSREHDGTHRPDPAGLR